VRFDIKEYEHLGGDVAMRCQTFESAIIFLEYLDSVGKRWCSGHSYNKVDRWGDYEEDTCYFFNIGEFCDLDWCETQGYQILEFDDFEWGEPKDIQSTEQSMSFEEMFYGTCGIQTTI
jgi:hypothetical protein